MGNKERVVKCCLGALLLTAGGAFAAVDVTASQVLTDDTDWREQGVVTVASGVVLDLAGHRLSLSSIDGSGTITDTVGGGVVYMDVETGITVNNTNVLFAGQLRFVKDGGGVFLQTRKQQTYSGGTLVASGTLRSHQNADKTNPQANLCFGATGTEIRVERGATLDLWNSYDNTQWKYVLNGGHIRLYDNSGSAYGHTQISDLTLLADSTMDAGESGFVSSGYGPTTVALNGHQLSINCSDNKVVFLYHTTFTTPGTLKFTNAAKGYFIADKTSVDASKITIINPGTSRIIAPTTLGNFEGAKCDNRTSLLTIIGRFKSTGASIPNVQLADGATLDLTDKTGAWDPSSLGGTITYAAGATVTVDLNGRADLAAIADGDGYVFKWAAAPTNATLVPDPVTASAFTLVPVADGLKLVRREGVAKTAQWTGTADDGDWTNAANWSCIGFDDQPLSAVPCSQTAVTFGSSVPNFTSPVTAFGRIVGAVNLSTDVNWCGLSTTVFADGLTLDLCGHKLTLTALNGESSARATITDTVGGGELHLFVDEGTELTGRKVRLAGSLKVVKEGAGVYNPVLADQTYTGGTDIKAGVVRMANGAGSGISSLGARVGPVRVESGALLDGNYARDFYERLYILSGGDFVNFGFDVGNGTAQLENLKLEADAVLDQIDIIGSGYRATRMDLGGHTLTLKGNDSYLYNVTVQNGTIRKQGGCLNVSKTAFNATGVDFDLDCAIWTDFNMDADDLSMGFVGSQAKGAGVISIHGTYLPRSNYIHNFKLLDGSAIDLSAWARPFNLTSPTTGKTLEIASAAKILVKLGGRTLTDGETLIVWTPNTKPSASVEYALESPHKERWRLSARDDGLRAIFNMGTILYVR